MNVKTTIVIFLLWTLHEIFALKNVGAALEENSTTISNETAVHSRKKRYLVFPKGASLQILLEVLSHVPTRFKVFVGPTLQIAWPLPSEPFGNMMSSSKDRDLNDILFYTNSKFLAEKHLNKRKFKVLDNLANFLTSFGMTVGLAWQLPDDPKIYAESKKKHKIYKRNSLKKLESFMKPNGANGRQCVLRALCESGQRTPSKKEFLREILHRIFSYDEDGEDETQEDKIYREAHRSTNKNCKSLYPECDFSIFDAIK